MAIQTKNKRAGFAKIHLRFFFVRKSEEIQFVRAKISTNKVNGDDESAIFLRVLDIVITELVAVNP